MCIIIQRMNLRILDRCVSCNSYKRVNLNAEWLCDSCSNKQICPSCNTRRAPRFFRNGRVDCITCLKRQANPNIRVSVQNSFMEKSLVVSNRTSDLHSMLEEQGSSIKDNLEEILSDDG